MRLVDRFLAFVSRGLIQLSLRETPLDQRDLRRFFLWLGVGFVIALLVVDVTGATQGDLPVGSVAPRTVRAPFAFSYPDFAAQERAKEQARATAEPVYVYQASKLDDGLARIERAFADAREALAARRGDAEEIPPLTEDQSLHLLEAFLGPLGVRVSEPAVQALIEDGFGQAAEDMARRWLRQAMEDRYIVASRDQLPADRRPILLLREGGEEAEAERFSDLERILIPEEARKQIALGPTPQTDAAASVARALVTANVWQDPVETAERAKAAADEIPLDVQKVEEGEALFREGQVLTAADIDKYRALQAHKQGRNLPKEIGVTAAFVLLLLGALYTFASTHLTGFSTRVRDIAAAGALLVTVTLMARLVEASAPLLAGQIGFGADPKALGYLVPVGGAVMLARLLLGVSWTVVMTIAASIVAGLVLEFDALFVVFFLISGIAAASAVEHTRERIAIIRAGAVVGVLNAATVLIIHLLQQFTVPAEQLAPGNPVWAVGAAFLGGLGGGFIVLALLPVLESLGFVTDYRLMELASLNHPLLRKLMLRAPGSYHHSVVVGTLAEAGCEAIGANALLAKVASYFHDIGKSLKPQYFIENQRSSVSRHTTLDPHVSAKIIVQHVTDGGRLAREYNLPQPILDNIYMHHGTGVLQYFYTQAQQMADDPDEVDIRDFRYPGPKPTTREAGVIMLADKLEAATRTLRRPDETNIRTMIGRIVNSVIA
ncbi:MAG: HDIG domain-containing metalloprotein, partial [Myxococcota bacterium]